MFKEFNILKEGIIHTGMMNEKGVIILNPQRFDVSHIKGNLFKKLIEIEKDQKERNVKYELLILDLGKKELIETGFLYDYIYSNPFYIVGRSLVEINNTKNPYYEYTSSLYDFNGMFQFDINGEMYLKHNNIIITKTNRSTDFKYYIYDDKGNLLDKVKSYEAYFSGNVLVIEKNNIKSLINTNTKEVIIDNFKTNEIRNQGASKVLIFYNELGTIVKVINEQLKEIDYKYFIYLEDSNSYFENFSSKELYGKTQVTKANISMLKVDNKVGLISFNLEEIDYKIIQDPIYENIYIICKKEDKLNNYSNVYFICEKVDKKGIKTYDLSIYNEEKLSYEIKEKDILSVRYFYEETYKNEAFIITRLNDKGQKELFLTDIDLKGMFVETRFFGEIQTLDNNYILFYDKETTKYGMFDLKTNYILPQEYSYIRKANDVYDSPFLLITNEKGITLVNTKNQKEYLTANGFEKFEVLEKNNDKRNSKCLIINLGSRAFIYDSETGKDLFPKKEIIKIKIYNDNKFIIKENNKYSILNIDSMTYSYENSDEIETEFNKELLIIKKNDKYSFIDKHNNLIANNIGNYEVEYFNSLRHIKIYQGAKQGLISSKNFVLPCKFSEISEPFKNGYFEVSEEIYDKELNEINIKKGVYRVISDFEEIVPCIFDELKLNSKLEKIPISINGLKGNICISNENYSLNFDNEKSVLSKLDIIYELNVKGYDSITKDIILEYIQENGIDISDINQIDLILSNIIFETKIGNEENY